jgi:hypothetical protein
VTRELLAQPNDDELRRTQTRLAQACRSPWLFYDYAAPDCIGVLAGENVQYGSRRMGYGRNGVVNFTQFAWRSFLYDLNCAGNRRPPTTHQGAVRAQVSPTIDVTDLRDSFLSFTYRTSGYQWLVTKLAAGHTSMRTLGDYLRKRRWRAHGEAQVSRLQHALWHEIREHSIVDPAILYAMVQRGEISEEQRERWLSHKHRTRLGLGCRDFNHPPPNIAPDHKEGTGCRIHRCTLCEHGLVFSDSLDLLARRLAEVLSIQAGTPAISWLESSFPEELESLQQTISQFDPDEAEAALNKWARAIDEGRHRVIDQEGAYE